MNRLVSSKKKATIARKEKGSLKVTTFRLLLDKIRNGFKCETREKTNESGRTAFTCVT